MNESPSNSHQTMPGHNLTAPETKVVARTARGLRALGILTLAGTALLIASEGLADPGEWDAVAAAILILALLPLYLGITLIRAGTALRATAAATEDGGSHVARGLAQLGNAAWTLFVAGSVFMLLVAWSLVAPRFAELSPRERAYATAMRADLRELESQQDAFFNQDRNGDGLADGTFTSDTNALGHWTSAGVVLRIREATDSGWAATTTHLSLSDKACVVYVGRVVVIPLTAGGERPSGPRKIVCDGM